MNDRFVIGKKYKTNSTIDYLHDNYHHFKYGNILLSTFKNQEFKVTVVHSGVGDTYCKVEFDDPGIQQLNELMCNDPYTLDVNSGNGMWIKNTDVEPV